MKLSLFQRGFNPISNVMVLVYWKTCLKNPVFFYCRFSSLNLEFFGMFFLSPTVLYPLVHRPFPRRVRSQVPHPPPTATVRGWVPARPLPLSPRPGAVVARKITTDFPAVFTAMKNRKVPHRRSVIGPLWAFRWTGPANGCETRPVQTTGEQDESPGVTIQKISPAASQLN